MRSAVAAFHPLVRTWFEARFGRPSAIQELGWPLIGGGHDVLLCAPTGSGKTLAAFLWSINQLVIEAQSGLLSDQVSVLYVSPLKALANDIRLNLEEPLSGVGAAAAQSGLTLASIRAGLRTGDTPASERGAMLRRPPQILVTTPESLFILLTSSRFRQKLESVRWVIVDELHAMAGNKRGAHLALTLERLERMVKVRTGSRPVRIGLSATLSPIEELGRFLTGGEVDAGGERHERPCRIVTAGDGPRQLDLQVLAPGPELGPLATHPHWDAVYDRIAELIREHRTTLVFTLSRRWAERVALALQKRLGQEAVMAHHGSMARAERLTAEQRLKRGELRAIVATASLELGIDVGAVELVCQIDSPKSISAAIQRVGRSGHALGQTPKGCFFAMTLDDLLECGAAVRAIRAGRLDQVEIPAGCLDVAAQQIVAIAAEEGDISEAELLRLLRGAHNFASLTAAQIHQLLEQMAAELPERIQGAYPKIFYDRVGARVRPRRGARIAAITSGGTIPEAGNYDVVIESQQRKIGDVEEDFAQESVRGDVFALGSMPWQIQRISRGRLMVEPAPGMAPTLPFWMTEAAGRTPAISNEISDLRHEIARRLPDPAQAQEFLARECAMDSAAATQAVDYVRRGLDALGAIPDEHTLIAERFFDGLGGTQIVLHSPLGIRLNRGLGLALRKRLCQSFDFEIQASATDDGVLLALNSRHSFPLEEVFTFLNSRTVRETLVQALLAAPMFEVRFRHTATRALSIMRNAGGRKVPAWIQRLRAQDLTIALFPQQQACFDNKPAHVEIPDHFIVHEALRECLEESTDIKRLCALLEGIERGRMRTLAVDSIAPSVFAQRLLLAWDYSFLDDGERANRRSRSVMMNRGMAEDVLRTEDLSEVLARDAVERVAGEVTATAPTRRARDADELYELIKSHGALSDDEIGERTATRGSDLVRELAGGGRIVPIRLTYRRAPAWIAAEDSALFGAAYRGAEPIASGAVSNGDGIDRDSAREELVRRALRTSGPVRTEVLSDRLGFQPAEIQRHLAALEAKGAVFRGRFSGAGAESWCDRYNLERIHRLTLEKVRAEIEPCDDHEYAAFAMRWHHIGGDGLPPGADGVAAVLDQLSGVALDTELWERAIFPARVPDYRHEYLDLLCLSGQMVWVAKNGGGTVPEVPSRIAFVPRGSSPVPSARAENPHPEDPKQQIVLKVLRDGGALYLDQIAQRTELSDRDVLRALWSLAAEGWATNDSFAPIRLMASAPDVEQAIAAPPDRKLSRYDAGLRARLKSSLGGRWVAIDGAADVERGAEWERELAMTLLRRHGILTREVLATQPEASWSDLLFALRRLEYSGTIRRGYFVRSLGGEQYALPEAVEMLRAIRTAFPARPTMFALCAMDPANPFGAALPGCGIARDSGNIIVIAGGRPTAGLAARDLICLAELDSADFSAAVAAILKLKPKFKIDTVNGEPALNSAWVSELAAMRFHSDGRSLIYDGLPGPMPARAAAIAAAKSGASRMDG
ncbi:MAG: DEAD/DEAH box helicase [Candidatus Binataceae bacterium]